MHTQAIQTIYAAFGRGDIPAILAHIDEQVIWEYGTSGADVPWLVARQGHAGVTKFFEVLGAEIQIRQFELKAVLGNASSAVALIDAQLHVVRTGKTIHELDEAHIWHFGEHGRVVRFRHAVDTLQHLRAWQK
jgi:ketosteroid isomerase-like protein